MVRMIHRHAPQLPRALLGRPRICREAGGGAALHAGGWTVAGTRAWGACVTYQASRAVEARLCCAYPEDEGIHQERHDTCRERACLISLSFAKCIGNTLESLMLASRLVAQRVSYETYRQRHYREQPTETTPLHLGQFVEFCPVL